MRKIIDTKLILLILLFLVSILPGINYVALAVQVIIFFVFFIKKDKVNLAVLLFSYSLYGKSLSIYSYKLIYALIFFLAVIYLPKFFDKKINLKRIYFIIFTVSYFFIYSFIKNFYFQPNSFISDFIIIIGCFAGLFLFKDIDSNKLFLISKKIFAFYIITSLFCIIFNYGFSKTTDWWGRNVKILVMGESVPLFLFLILYKFFFSTKNIFLRISLLLLYFICAIKLQDIGSMVTIFFILCLFFLFLLRCFFSKYKARMFFISICFLSSIWIIFAIASQSSFLGKYDAIAFKINNISKLFENFSFSDRKKINLIPLSPYVRLLELINITKSGTPYTILFGNGAGGSYTDNYYPFENKNAGKILGPDDFPLEQRISHIFTSAHNLGYPYLKYGLVWFLFFLIFIIFRLSKKNSRNPFNFYLGFIVFLCISCYIGFTFQTSIAVSIFFICFYKNTNKIDKF